jgi:hypothetical protein
MKFPTAFLSIASGVVQRVLVQDDLVDWLAEQTVHAAATARSLGFRYGMDSALPATDWAAKSWTYLELIAIMRGLSARETDDMFVVLQACLIGDVLYPSTKERRW